MTTCEQGQHRANNAAQSSEKSRDGCKPSHMVEYAELLTQDSKFGRILSLYQQLLYVLQPRYHEVVARMQAPNPS